MTRAMKPSCCATLPRFLRMSSLQVVAYLLHEFADVAGFGKDVGGVPQLRDFGDDRARQLEYVFVAEEIDVLAALLQLLVKVRIVVRLPTELSDIEIRRYSKASAEFAQFPLLQRLPLKTDSNLLYGVIVLAKALIRAASLSKRLLGV